jgi:hypothetical protein
MDRDGQGWTGIRFGPKGQEIIAQALAWVGYPHEGSPVRAEDWSRAIKVRLSIFCRENEMNKNTRK